MALISANSNSVSGGGVDWVDGAGSALVVTTFVETEVACMHEKTNKNQVPSWSKEPKKGHQSGCA